MIALVYLCKDYQVLFEVAKNCNYPLQFFTDLLKDLQTSTDFFERPAETRRHSQNAFVCLSNHNLFSSFYLAVSATPKTKRLTEKWSPTKNYFRVFEGTAFFYPPLLLWNRYLEMNLNYWCFIISFWICSILLALYFTNVLSSHHLKFSKAIFFKNFLTLMRANPQTED